MKKIALLAGCVLLSLSLIMLSCKKDKDTPSNPSTPTTNVTSYFGVQNGTFRNATFPAATSQVVLNDVNMNQNVLAGGTSYVSFKSQVLVNKIYVGVKDVYGYFEVAPASGAKDEISYDFILILDQELTDTSFTVYIAILDENGAVSQTYPVTVSLITAGTGQLQISLSFDNDKDIDLHLIEPNGDHIFYGNELTQNGGFLDVDSNPSCSIDGINNENIFYSDSAYIEPGTYSVYVDMFENCDESIATNFVLSIFYNGSLIQTVEGQNPISGTFPIGFPSNYGGWDIQNDIDPVCTFVIQGSGAKRPTRKFEPRPLTESAKIKLAQSK